ncbi:MAG TPA: guanitoxin biosynthesis pre-guanitoxin forming N-methyltransferase GntF [Povalibacter sp.]
MSAPVSSFADWSAEAYLADYYSRIEPEERCTLRFLVEQFRKLPRNCLALEFGIGPTLHHVLPLSPYASEIHVADLLPSNLEAVRKWQERECGAHDWAEFTRRVLIYEGNLLPTESDVHAREELTRSRITQRLLGDAHRPQPLGPGYERRYDCVLSCYCADSATADKLEWSRLMRNITYLLAPGGLLVVAALRRCSGYRVGGKCFPSAGIDEHDMGRLFERLYFRSSGVTLRVEQVPEQRTSGFESVLLASGLSPLEGPPVKSGQRSAQTCSPSAVQRQ